MLKAVSERVEFREDLQFAIVLKLLINVLLPCIHNTKVSLYTLIYTGGSYIRERKWDLQSHFSWFWCETKEHGLKKLTSFHQNREVLCLCVYFLFTYSHSFHLSSKENFQLCWCLLLFSSSHKLIMMVSSILTSNNIDEFYMLYFCIFSLLKIEK